MRKIWVTLLLFALVSVVSAYAQEMMLRVTIPFGFSVGNAPLPAGDYTVQRMSADLVQVHGVDTPGSAVAMVRVVTRGAISEVITGWQPGPASTGTGAQEPRNAPANSSADYCIVFNKYGDAYFMSNIWIGHEGRELSISKSERALRVAGMPRPVETVLLAAVTR